MLTLALDTGTRVASVAVGEGSELLGESLLPVRATHSETVLPEVERLLRACGRSVVELEAVAVSAGPGSFTGVRIGASLAKGLCFARCLPLFAYSGLAVLAAGSGATEPVCALLDARRRQVYWAVYCIAERFEQLSPPRASSLEEALVRVAARGARLFVGDGAIRHGAAIRAAGGHVLPSHLGAPRAAALIWLAHTFSEAGRIVDAARWEPEYVRLPSAERLSEEGTQ